MYIHPENRESFIGRRIVCILMENDPDPIPSGTKGTIEFIDDMGIIHPKWDNGRTLGLDSKVDMFEVLDRACQNPLYRECAVFFHNGCRNCPVFK
jgi:hypothetical protein